MANSQREGHGLMTWPAANAEAEMVQGVTVIIPSWHDENVTRQPRK